MQEKVEVVLNKDLCNALDKDVNQGFELLAFTLGLARLPKRLMLLF